MKRMIAVVLLLSVTGCTSITYNCNAPGSCSPKPAPVEAPASTAPKG
jgi:hypothetical protein